MENIESPSQSESTQEKGSSKTIFIIVGVILLLIFGIGGYMFMGKKTAQPTSTQGSVQNVPSPTSESAFLSIKDALSKSISLQCDYTDDTGRKTISYMKNGAIRSDITAQNTKESGSFIMKDEKVYYWNGKVGTMMEFDANAIMENVTPGAQKGTPSAQQKPENVVGDLEKFKQYCKVSVLDDSLFVPPADVKFTDLSNVIKAATKTSPGAAAGGAMTEEQIKQLQEQFGQ